MPGSKTNAMNRKEILAAVRAVPPAENFVWDGADEDERPTSDEELRAGVATYRAAGPGRKTRMNDALKDWLHTHSSP